MKPGMLFSDTRLQSYPQRLHRLRCLTALFCLLLVVPVSAIFYLGFQQYEKDLLVEYQRQAENVTQSINRRLYKQVTFPNGIFPGQFDHYQYLYNPETRAVTRVLSPLAITDFSGRVPGIVGYFQIDRQGRFNSPAWPHVIGSPEDKITAGATLDPARRTARELALEVQSIIAESKALQTLVDKGLAKRISRFRLIADLPDYFIFHRIIDVNGQTKLQGYVLDRAIFLDNQLIDALNFAQLPGATALRLETEAADTLTHYFVYRPNRNNQHPPEIVALAQADGTLGQQLITTHPLKWPLDNYRLTYSTASLPLTSTALYAAGLMVTLLIAIILGCYGFYRIGVKQLTLAEQRLNFVSSVSHELKTPLTSIRMYSEMLKSGQVLSSDHQRDYYDFIFSESERLSRLIDNILQLAKLSQPHHNVAPEYVKLSILTDVIRSKVSSLLVKNDFEMNVRCGFEHPDEVLLWVDVDAFTQVVLNIADNAVKFFDREKIQDTGRQKIDVDFSLSPDNSDQVKLIIRDYGDGISAEQENRIFDLFYRGGSELTRTTQGTGIGLALVNELMQAQQGTIGVKRMAPGLAMEMSFRGRIPAQAERQQDGITLTQR